MEGLIRFHHQIQITVIEDIFKWDSISCSNSRIFNMEVHLILQQW